MGEVPESKFKLETAANANQPFESNLSHPTNDTVITDRTKSQQNGQNSSPFIISSLGSNINDAQ